MTDVDTARIIVATADYTDGEVVLSMQDKDRTKVDFILDPMAVATLALTLQPSMRMALADHRAKHPECDPGRPEVPDFYDEEGT